MNIVSELLEGFLLFWIQSGIKGYLLHPTTSLRSTNRKSSKYFLWKIDLTIHFSFGFILVQNNVDFWTKVCLELNTGAKGSADGFCSQHIDALLGCTEFGPCQCPCSLEKLCSITAGESYLVNSKTLVNIWVIWDSFLQSTPNYFGQAGW